MNGPFAAAGGIAFALGAVHSWMGEKHLIGPLVRGEQLPLSGNVGLKKVALRVTWHFATIAMWSSAATLVFLARSPLSESSVGVARILAATYAGYTLLVFLTPGLRLVYLLRHAAWLAFAAVAALSWWGTVR